MKTIFFFWGNEKMSWLRYLTLYSFRKLNPTWKIELYYNKSYIHEKTWSSFIQQDFFSYLGEDFSKKLKSLNVDIIPWECIDQNGNNWDSRLGPSQKSNFFKWQKLSESVGIYADMDILFIKSLDTLEQELNKYDTTICWYPNLSWSIGFLASKGNNQFFRDVWENGFKCVTGEEYQSAGVINLKNMLAKKNNEKTEWDSMIELYPNLKAYNIPVETFYPLIWNQMDIMFGSSRTLPDNCYGLHWYAGHPLSQNFNNLVNEDSVKKLHGIFFDELRKILK